MNFIPRPLQPSRYKRKAIRSSRTNNLIAGSDIDRLAGLESLLSRAKSKTILDVGCHDGGVAEAFAKAGAARVDGCDISRNAIEQARGRLNSYAVPSALHVCDLSRGPQVLRRLELLPHYDIVCYLGVHHHLLNQMRCGRYRQLVAAIAKKTRQIMVTRTPDIHHGALQEILSHSAMTPDSELIKANEGVGPLRIYRSRTTAGALG